MAQKQKISRFVLWFGCLGALLLLTGCIVPETPLPTLAPVAVLPSPTATSLPATLDISTPLPQSGDPTSDESADPAATIQAQPTTKPTVTPTSVNPLINVSDPNPNELLFLGSETTVRGLVQRDPDQTIQVSLVSSNGRLLTEVAAVPNDFGKH